MAEEAGCDGEIVLEAPANVGAPAEVEPLTARFVRYPGSQQLILWLPRAGDDGYGAVRMFGPGGALLEEAPARDRLNGSVQILTDTHPWPPGDYRIEITHADGWRHEIAMRKWEADAPAPAATPPSAISADSPPIVYRDGFGNILPNEDLEMRAAAQKRLADRFGRRLVFDGTARAGSVTYIEGDTRIRFYHEMCAGRVHISIDLPPPARWEQETGTPLASREDIVEFIARETQRLQASTWSYEIHDDRIDFVD